MPQRALLAGACRARGRAVTPAGSEEQDGQYSIEPECYVADAKGEDQITHHPFADQMANQEMSTEPSEPRWWINEPSPAATCGHDEERATNNKAESDEEKRRVGYHVRVLVRANREEELRGDWQGSGEAEPTIVNLPSLPGAPYL